MSAVWFKLTTLLCLSCTALSGPESSGVVWRDAGQDITIQCRLSKKDQESLILMKGLSEDIEVLYIDGKSKKNTIDNEFKDRLQTNGEFPNMDILIKNLSAQDTGPYWCGYKKFNRTSIKNVYTKGEGSVLLVVKDTTCDGSNNNQVLLIAVICAAVLLAAMICFIIWIILMKTKTVRTTKKQRRVPTNDVYEDMRGTLRR